jgi:hypothetical protein
MIAGALLGTFAKDIGMLCGSRVLIGLGTVAGRECDDYASADGRNGSSHNGT